MFTREVKFMKYRVYSLENSLICKVYSTLRKKNDSNNSIEFMLSFLASTNETKCQPQKASFIFAINDTKNGLEKILIVQN